MPDTPPPYNKVLADLYAKKRVDFANSEIGSKEAGLLLNEITEISNKLFGIEETEELQPVDNPNLVNDIAVWLVKDMIRAVFYDDYSSIGEGTPEELQAAYSNLIIQYHSACKNEHFLSCLRLEHKKKTIELHWAIVNSIAAIMQKNYRETGAEQLRKLYPAYQFSIESFMTDLERVRVGEIANERQYELICQQLEKMNSSGGKQKEQSKLERHANFMHRLKDINKFEGYNASNPNEITVLELAVLENRISDEIERLQDQAQRNGSSN